MLSINSTNLRSQKDLYDLSYSINTIRQTGSVQDYIVDFDILRMSIPKGHISEAMFVVFFVRGLKPEIFRHVFMDDPKTMDAAKERARRVEQCISDLDDSNDADYSYHSQNYATDSGGNNMIHSQPANHFKGRRSSRGEKNARNQSRKYGRKNYHSEDIPEGTIISKTELIRGICRQNNLCYNCKKPGHKSSQCSE